MATIVTRTGKGSALSTAEADANFTNLNNDKIEAVADDTAPSLGGDLNLGNNVITTGVINGNVELHPNGTGLTVVDSDLRVTGGTISVDVADTNLSLIPGSGSGAVNISGTNGVQITGDGIDAKIFTSSTDNNLKLSANGTGKIVLNSESVLNNTLDVNNNTITNTVLNGNIVLSTTGTGSVSVNSASGITVSSGLVSAATTNSNLTLSANGTGAIVLNQAGGTVLTETNLSGYGVITGETSKGFAALTNAGAQTANDPQLALDNGGGATLTAGGNSTLSLLGQTVTITGNTTISNSATIGLLKSYAETVETLSAVSGTLSIDSTAGPVKYVVPSGNITINGFTSPSIGETISFFVDQSTSSTSFTLTLGANIKVPGGTAPTLTASGNDLLTITCLDDSSQSGSEVYIANIVNDFQ